MDKLNNYVLMEIFEYLDGSSLKSCMETCSSWAEVISTSSLTMKKLPLILDSERLIDQKQKFEEIKTLKRNYHTLILEEIKVTCLTMTSLKLHISNIRVLELIHVDQTEASWKNILKHLSCIEKITIVESKISFSKKLGTEEKIDIPTLKSLTVIDSDWQFFECIGETQMEELKVHHRFFYPSDVIHFFGFLKLQKSIVSLAVRVQQILFYKILLDSEDNSLKFRLKKLAVSYKKSWDDESQGKTLVDILDQHKDTLEHFEVETKLSPKIYEHIFSKMKFKSLMLNASYLPKDTAVFYNSIRQNIHLKKLVLTGELNNQVALGLFNIYRHIENLSINNWATEIANDVLINIINNLTKISSLKIPYLVSNTPELSMSSLKNLHIESVTAKANFQSFVLNQNNLEKLSAKWIHDDINDVMEQAANRLNNIKSATFGPGFKPTYQTLKALKENCKNLHKLEIFYDWNLPISENILNDINGDGLSLYQYQNDSAPKIFPMEKGVWHEEDKIFINSTSNLTSDTESMDDEDSDADYDFYDSDETFDNPFLYSDSDEMDFEDYMLREVIEFLIN